MWSSTFPGSRRRPVESFLSTWCVAEAHAPALGSREVCSLSRSSRFGSWLAEVCEPSQSSRFGISSRERRLAGRQGDARAAFRICSSFRRRLPTLSDSDGWRDLGSSRGFVLFRVFSGFASGVTLAMTLDASHRKGAKSAFNANPQPSKTESLSQRGARRNSLIPCDLPPRTKMSVNARLPRSQV